VIGYLPLETAIRVKEALLKAELRNTSSKRPGLKGN
jgi:hypothetical protein